jgi:hypothetical protein
VETNLKPTITPYVIPLARCTEFVQGLQPDLD